MVKVSIILPVYNVGQYLDETFQSLLNQTLKEIEIIAVNDGSTDHSEEIIKKYVMQASRISYYYQANQGTEHKHRQRTSTALLLSRHPGPHNCRRASRDWRPGPSLR